MTPLSRLEDMLSDFSPLFKHNNFDHFQTFVKGLINTPHRGTMTQIYLSTEPSGRYWSLPKFLSRSVWCVDEVASSLRHQVQTAYPKGVYVYDESHVLTDGKHQVGTHFFINTRYQKRNKNQSKFHHGHEFGAIGWLAETPEGVRLFPLASRMMDPKSEDTNSFAVKVQIRTFNEYGYSAWSSEFSVTTLQVSEADAVPSLGSTEIGQLGALLTYDTVIFNELYNGANDAMDWLELRNVSGSDLSLDDWQLTIRTSGDTVTVPFPAGMVIPAGEVLLLTNIEPVGTSEASILSVVSEAFMLPQADFALILRSPTAFGDVAGNYVEGEAERGELSEPVQPRDMDTVSTRQSQ